VEFADANVDFFICQALNPWHKGDDIVVCKLIKVIQVNLLSDNAHVLQQKNQYFRLSISSAAAHTANTGIKVGSAGTEGLQCIGYGET
jgi:hypothetical protein